MDDRHPDPPSEAAARVAQLAAMSISVAEALARLRAQRLADQAAADRQAAAAARAQARAAAAAARLTYSPALDDAWLRGAPTSALLDAWVATQLYPSDDPTAPMPRTVWSSGSASCTARRCRSTTPPALTATHPSPAWRQRPACSAANTAWTRSARPIHRSLADLQQHLAAAATRPPT